MYKQRKLKQRNEIAKKKKTGNEESKKWKQIN